jgi:F0F1-type ATP synthase membrane subunit b/b'
VNRPARGGAGRSAAAVEAYQRAAKAGDEAIQAAREIRVRAGRRLGKEIKAARKKGELAKQALTQQLCQQPPLGAARGG